jgi:branched-chain amino acid transport system substrate-binding protein
MRTQHLIFWILLLLISPIYAHHKIFDSLPAIEQYAASVVENPNIPIANWENPDFAPYHKKMAPSFIEKLLISADVLQPLWDINSFIDLLKIVTSKREYAGYQAPFVQKIEPSPGYTFYIFSNLVGAFHSLVRDLRSLEQHKIIDEKLKVIEPNCYLVFNGNIASRSAYALETLTVILKLLDVNEASVIVTSGDHEIERHWQHYAIKRELKIRAAGLQVERLPFGDLMEQFINTIPAALYLVGNRASDNVSVVRISNTGFENKELSSTACGVFFEQPNQDICFVDLKDRNKSTVDVTVQALIRGDPFYKILYTPSQGLVAAGKEDGVVTWATASGPVQASQELFQFYNDAYVKLSTAKSLDDWILTLYSRDVREHMPISPSLTVKLLSRQELNPQEAIEAHLKIVNDEKNFLGQQIALLDKKITMQQEGNIGELGPTNLAALKTKTPQKEKVTEQITQFKEGLVPLGKKENAISVVTLVDFSGITQQEGASIEAGIKTVFNTFNAKGGLHGTPLDLISFDIKHGVPGFARKEVIKALEKYNTGLILMPESTGVLEDYVDMIAKKQVLVLFPAASGSAKVRNKELTNLFFLRASGQQEAYKITSYVARERGRKKFVLFYSNNSFGKSELEGAQKALKKLTISDYVTVPAEVNNLDFTEQVKSIKQFNPDALGIFSEQAAAKELLNQLGTAWLIDKDLFGTQDLSAQSFRNYIDRNKLKFICTSVVPNPAGPLEIAKQYSEATAQMQISNDIYCFEGYIGADLFTYILQNIPQPITSQKIIEFIENIHNLQYKGLNFDFDPESRQLLHSIWLIADGNDWKELKLTRSAKPKNAASAQNGQKLHIGSALDLSRGDAAFGKITKRVMEFLVDRANSHKEKDKPTIELTILDHEYSPDKARNAIETLLSKYHTDIILCPVGSQPFASFLDYINKGDVITLFPVTVTTGKRSDIPNALFLGAAYQEQARIVTNYCIEHLPMQRVVLLYQDDLLGKVLLESVKPVLESKKINFTPIAYERNSTDFATQIEQIKKIDPDAIGLFALPDACIEFLRQLGKPYTKRIRFFGANTLSTQSMQEFLTKNEIQCVRTSIVPNYKDTSLPLCQEFLQTMAEAHIKPDIPAFETHISTQIFLNIVNNIKGPIDKQSILQACKEIHDVSFKGLMLNYDPETNQLINYIWLDEGKQAPWLRIPLKTEVPLKGSSL